MKSLKLILSMMLLAATTLIVSCGNGGEKQDGVKTKMTQDGPEYTSAFVCPMYCTGSGSAEMGECPECGMDYVANKNFKKDAGHDHSGHDHGHDHSGHDHGHDHEGHDHSDHDGHDHSDHDGHDHSDHDHEGHNH